MAVPRMQVFFTQSEGRGWSENYYWLGSTTFATLSGQLATFRDLRKAMLTTDSQLVRIRIASGFKRDPIIYDYASAGSGVGTYPGIVNDSNDAVLIRLESQGIGYNKIFLRGIADDMVGGDVFSPTGPWLTAYSAWRAFILGSTNFAVQAFVDNPQPPITVTSANPQPPKGINIKTAAAIPAQAPATSPVGSQVRVKGSSIIGYNGVKTVTAVLSPTAPYQYLLGGAQPQQAAPVTDFITVTPLVPQDGIPTELFYEGYTSRKVGRPFGVPRGRARTLLTQRP